MNRSDVARYGFRIVGPCTGERRAIDWQTAFEAYAACDSRAEVNRESYLSAFTFPLGFRRYLTEHGTTRGYTGATGGDWLWFDIDREGDIDAATADARRLAASIVDRFGCETDELLIFFSGSKGYHAGLPLAVCGSPPPVSDFHATAKRFAAMVAADCGVAIDIGVYDRVRAFRAPNSRHPRTSLYKRYLTVDELMGLKPSRIIELAAEPVPFDIHDSPRTSSEAVKVWQSAHQEVNAEAEAMQHRRAAGGPVRLNRSTLEFIRDGAADGDRHRLLFSAAANLGEFGCPASLAHELLSERALDCGLSPSDVRRQIDCGLAYKGGSNGG